LCENPFADTQAVIIQIISRRFYCSAILFDNFWSHFYCLIGYYCIFYKPYCYDLWIFEPSKKLLDRCHVNIMLWVIHGVFELYFRFWTQQTAKDLLILQSCFKLLTLVKFLWSLHAISSKIKRVLGMENGFYLKHFSKCCLIFELWSKIEKQFHITWNFRTFKKVKHMCKQNSNWFRTFLSKI